MNFKQMILIILLLLTSCGVKAPPKEYKDNSVQDYIKNLSETKKG